MILSIERGIRVVIIRTVAYQQDEGKIGGSWTLKKEKIGNVVSRNQELCWGKNVEH